MPLSQLDNGGNHVVGVWSASERLVTKVTLAKWRGRKFVKKTPEWQQVSRLGNPLINEVVIPTELKDKWNATTPDKDKQFEQYYSSPILAKLLSQLYPQFGPFQETCCNHRADRTRAVPGDEPQRSRRRAAHRAEGAEPQLHR